MPILDRFSNISCIASPGRMPMYQSSIVRDCIGLQRCWVEVAPTLLEHVSEKSFKSKLGTCQFETVFQFLSEWG